MLERLLEEEGLGMSSEECQRLRDDRRRGADLGIIWLQGMEIFKFSLNKKGNLFGEFRALY